MADTPTVVMPGLDPGIHVFLRAASQDVDGRVFALRAPPGHDEVVAR